MNHITKREKALLRWALGSHIHRYLMHNTEGRLNSAGKAHEHYAISKILAVYFTGKEDSMNDNCDLIWRIIHDYTQDVLTDRLDEVIGFPIDEHLAGREYDIYIDSFFEVLMLHLPKLDNLIKNG
jgi:hypothetical protein